MAHLNREKLPECQPHAQDASAFGVFEATGECRRLHQGGVLSKRYDHRDTGALFQRRWRGGQSRQSAAEEYGADGLDELDSKFLILIDGAIRVNELCRYAFAMKRFAATA